MNDVDSTQLAGLKELAVVLHVPYRTLEQWAYRNQSTGFPDPYMALSMGRIWRVRDVVQWWIDWDSPMLKMKNQPKSGHVDPELLTELGIDQGADNGK